MNKLTILKIKRNADQISTEDDVKNSDNDMVDICRKIYVNYYGKKYEQLDLSLYQTGTYKHPEFPNIEITPDFVRDDGVIIYLKLVQNDKVLRDIEETTIHLAMEILKLKNTELYTIRLKPSFNIKLMGNISTCESSSLCDEPSRRLLRSGTGVPKIGDFSEAPLAPQGGTAYMPISKAVSFIYSPQIVKNFISRMTPKRKKLDDAKELPGKTPAPKIGTKPVVGFKYGEWVAASKTRNYALKDTLVDWLDCWYTKSRENNKFRQPPVNNNNDYNFGRFIMSKGTEFEKYVIALIKKKFKPNEFVTICQNTVNFVDRIAEYENSTIDEMMKGTPLIYQALVMNRTGDLQYSYGFPDLLVRSDYLDKIVELNPLEKNMKTFRAPKLNGDYHYVVVDIKFTTLELCADGKKLRNSGSAPAYKCQLYIYNHALGLIQGYEPPESYILGRKFKYESRGKHFSGTHCFERFGHIEYNKWDKEYVSEAKAAISWVKKLRSEGQEWQLLPKPTVPELYPNMSSSYESHWDTFKNEYANMIGEITLLWNCGVKNREIAHENGVFSFMDPNCSSQSVGINGPKQAPILNEIIRINKKSKFDSAMERIYMKINKEIDNQWLEDCDLRISVDFETVGSIFDDFKSLPMAQDQNYLFMIGVGYKIKISDKHSETHYKMFLAAELSKDAEFQIIYQFYKFLRQITDKYLGKNEPIPSLYHWGHIERSFFQGLCDKLVNKIGTDIRDDIALMKKELDWFDLSECFKNNPIVINGCFKFGLKEVAGRLSELGLIKSSWNSKDCTNGNTAMVMAQKAYQLSKQTGEPIIKNNMIRQIMDYNKIDCIVVQEIIDLIRIKAETMDCVD